MKSNLLIEIGVEEIPASYLRPASEQFLVLTKDALVSADIAFDDAREYYTPRRFALIFSNIGERGESRMKRIYGPPESQAFDAEGNPTKAALGFAKSMGKSSSDIHIGERKGKRVCYIEKKESARMTMSVVKESLAGILSQLYFPKKMRWESSGFEFARPIRWMVVLLGKKVVPVTIAGVCASNKSRGPRFTGSKEIEIPEATKYVKILKKNHVVASYDEREQMVRQGIGSVLGEEYRVADDTSLLHEVANLVEYPTAFKGSYDRSFLKMPKDVLITAMKEHQRYFAVLDSRGKIRSNYVGVCNGLSKNIDEIIAGHDRVLSARLNDAQFYWQEDLKTPFSKRIPELKGVEWHRGLGTVFDKSKRLVELSLYLWEETRQGRREIIERGAMLAKVDLVTNMIKDGKEFTTLEGIIGKEYALMDEEDPDAAAVIAEHYLPRSPEDGLPTLKESVLVGIADRIDTLVGNFLIGEIPSGSFDPFGLRRCANGLLRLVDAFSMRFSLVHLLEKSIELFQRQHDITVKLKNEEVHSRIGEFLETRLTTYLSNLGIRYDITTAVISVQHDEIFELMSRAQSLSGRRKDEHFEELVVGQRRVANILGGIGDVLFSVDETYFDCDAERILWGEFCKQREEFDRAMKKHDYGNALNALLVLRPHIDDFFDNCMVMDKDKKKRENRVALLANLRELFNSYADFSLIVLEGETDKPQMGVTRRS